MAVAFGSVVSVSPATGSNTGASPSITTPATNPVVFACIGITSATATIDSLTITGFGGTASLVLASYADSTYTARTEIWKIVAPTANTAGTVRANFSASVPYQMAVVAYSGADQTDPAPTAHAVHSETAVGPETLTPTNLTANDATLGASANTIANDIWAITPNSRFVNNTTAINFAVGDNTGTSGVTHGQSGTVHVYPKIAVRIAAASSGTTRQPPSADLTLSSIAPLISLSYQPASADLTLSTSAPNLSGNITLSPVVADLTLSTSAPNLSGNITLSPVAANLALSSVAPFVLRFGYTIRGLLGLGTIPLGIAAIQPASASIALFTTAPTVNRTAHVAITFVQGNLALSPTIPAVVQDIRRDPAQGNISLTVTAPAVSTTMHVAVTPAWGDLALSQTAPQVVLTAHHAIMPSQGNAALLGTAPAILVSFGASPAQGDLALSAIAPAVDVSDHIAISPSCGNAIISTEAPGVVIGDHRSIVLTTADLVVSSQALTSQVTMHHYRSPSQGNIAFSGAFELLLHMDGDDASTVFLDSGGGAHTVTAHGDAQVDTGQMVFVGPALQVVANADYLSLDTGDYAFGTDDFCIDFRARLSSSSDQPIFYGGGVSGPTIDYDGSVLRFMSTAGTITGSALSTDTNYHIAATRAAGSTRLWLDGVQQGSTLTDVTDYGVSSSYPRIGGGRLSLPDGAVGLWTADNYATTTGGNIVVTNSMDASSISENILRSPRRLAGGGYGGFWAASGATMTDQAAIGPDGLTEATRIVAAGDWAIFYQAPATSISLPAGTYTIGVNAKRAVGSDQQFKIGGYMIGSSATFTAISTWQRFSYTFTLEDPTTVNICLLSFDGATGVDFYVDNVEMFNGSTDLGPSPWGSHMYLGTAAFSGVPTVTGGYIDFDVSGIGIIQFPTPVSISAFTVVAVYKQINDSGANGNALLLSRQDFQSYFSIFSQFNNTTKKAPGQSFNYGSVAKNTGSWNMIGVAAPHVVIWRFDGTKFNIFLDDVRVHDETVFSGTLSLHDLYVSAISSNLPCNGDKVHAIAMWNTAVADADVYDIVDYFQASTAPHFSMTSWQSYYFQDGDSQTSAIGSFAYLFGPNSVVPVAGNNYALGGAVLADLVSRRSAVSACLPPMDRRTGRKFLLSAWIGSNDLSAVDGTTQATNYASYVDDMQSDGWQVVCMPAISRTGVGGGATYDTNRAVFNGIITDVGWGHGTITIDIAANSHLGPDAAANDETYYQTDHVHLNNTGQALVETIVRGPLNELLS